MIAGDGVVTPGRMYESGTAGAGWQRAAEERIGERELILVAVRRQVTADNKNRRLRQLAVQVLEVGKGLKMMTKLAVERGI
jgi:hypothetical protein